MADLAILEAAVIPSCRDYSDGRGIIGDAIRSTQRSRTRQGEDQLANL